MATLIDPVEVDEVNSVEEPVQEEVTTSEGEAELAPMYQGKHQCTKVRQ